MKPLWGTPIILTAIAGAIITTILIFQKTNQPSIALTEEWTATEVVDGDSITVEPKPDFGLSTFRCFLINFF